MKKMKDRHFILVLFLAIVIFLHNLLNPFEFPYNWFSDGPIYSGFKYNIYWAAKDGFPVWTKTVFSGMPMLENLGIYAVLYPLNTFFAFIQPEYIFGISLIIHFLLSALFMYLFMKEITNDKLISFLSTLILVLSGWFIMHIATGHIQVITGLPWIIALFYLLEKLLKNSSLKYQILLGVSLALLFLTGHIQYFIYSVTALVIYFLVKNFYTLKKFKKNIFKLAISLIIAVVLVSPQLFLFYRFYMNSNRSRGVSWWFATRISFPPYHLITAAIPEFFGTPLDHSYLSTSNFWNLCIYIGIFPLILVLLTFLFRRDKTTAPFFILLIFSLLFSMGQHTPLYHLFYKYAPLFNVFRAPSRFLLFYILSASVLAGFGFKELFKLSKKNRFRITSLILLTLVVTVLATIFVVGQKQPIKYFLEREVLKTHKSYVEANSEWIQPPPFYLERIDKVYNHMFYGMISLILLLGASSVFIFFSKKVPKKTAIIIILFIFFDLWVFGSKYVNTVSHNEVFEESDVVNFLLNDTSDYRVLTLTQVLLPQHIASKYEIQLVEGGSGVQLRNFKNFLDRIGNRSSEKNTSPMISDIYNRTLLNFLNVKYIVSSKQLDDYALAYNGSSLVYRNDDYMSRAFFIGCEGESIVGVIEDSSNSISLNVSNEYPCTLVLSEVWYPGWRAYDNGQETEIYKFEDTLKSLKLDAGNHMIEFVYNPLSGLI